MQVHALVRFGPAEGTLARLKWFASISYIVGGHQYSSNDIEHGVLRGNKPSPANILSLIGLSSLAPLTFRTGDPRMQQVCSSCYIGTQLHMLCMTFATCLKLYVVGSCRSSSRLIPGSISLWCAAQSLARPSRCVYKAEGCDGCAASCVILQ